jgi:hypothetical protein
MQFQKILIPLGCLVFVAVAFKSYGWLGVAGATALLMMWMLLHFTRTLQVLKRAANRPVGYVDSAVMLNAKLRKGATLLHVVAMTRALGELLTPKDTQPEQFRWTDGTQSHVTCLFVGGKLQQWELFRPAPEAS